MKRLKTDYPGVFYREADRIGGKGKERVYYVLFKKDGRLHEEKVGRQYADDMTAAKAARICAIDQGVLEIRDDERFTYDAEQARNLGYDGKVCLNPRQVDLANRLFSPSDEEVAFSRRLVEASRAAEARGIGTIDFEGRMIDGPLLKRCEHILSRARP